MHSRSVGLTVAAAVFGLVSLAQLMRVLTGVDVSIAGHALPVWANAVAFVVAGGLAIWMFRLARHAS